VYENQTFEAILERMLSKISDEIDKREGSVAYDMLAPKAAELAVAYMELDNIINLGFAGTTYGSYLDLKVSEYGIVRLEAVKATGVITFSSAINGLVIPQGTVVYTDDNIRFLTDNVATISNGTATVAITAETGGMNGNVPTNTIINTEMAGATCTNATTTSGGADIESDEDLFARYTEKINAPVNSGNTNHYREWAQDIVGIGDARVTPIWNGSGTVKVTLISTDKRAVTAAKVTEVANYIDTVRPVGATVAVESAIEKVINVTATLTLSAGFTLAQVTPTIQQGIIDYFKEAAFVDPDIKYTKVGTIILGVNGVLDYTNLQLNNGTTNIVLGVNETPVVGTVTLS
jgi:uncharacterized phage protein gp47/JayE